MRSIIKYKIREEREFLINDNEKKNEVSMAACCPIRQYLTNFISKIFELLV